MASQLNPHLLSLYRHISRATSGIVIAVGLLVLAGWLFDISTLQSTLLGLATMKANTALAFILAGLSLWLNHTRGENQWIDRTAKGCATIASLIGLLTLSEYVFGWDLGIDQWLFRDRLTPENAFPGRMSPATALNLSVLGFALVILDRHQYRWPVEVFGLLALLTSVLVLSGYAYGIPSLYEFSPNSSIAIHTALTSSILCLGILFARPEQGLMQLFSRDNLGGVMARRLMPAAIVIPFVLGWLLLTGQQIGLYDSIFGLVLFAVSTVIVFASLIWWNAGLLQQADLVGQQAQAQLGQSKEREAAILDASLDAVITIDGQGHVLEFNPAAQKIFGYDRADVLGREMGELIIPPSLRAQHRAGLAKYLATGIGPVLGKRIELTGMRADRTEFPVELTITSIAGGEQPIFTGFVRDITQRKMTEEELRKNAARIQALADISRSLAAVHLDYQGVLDTTTLHISDLIGDACAIHLVSEDKPWLEAVSIYHPDPNTLAFLRKVWAANPLRGDAGLGGQVIRTGQAILIPVVSPEQRKAIVPSTASSFLEHIKIHSLLIVPLRAQGGALGTLTLTRDQPDHSYTNEEQAFVQDLADRAALSIANSRLYAAMQKLNNELEQRVTERTAQMEVSNKELEAFSYSVSHDLRAPLRSIDGYSQALLEDYGELLPVEGHNFLTHVRNSARRMAELIDDLLKLSQVTRAQIKLVPVDLTKLAESILADLQRTQPERNVKCIVAPNLRVSGDPNLLQIMLENLLNNAWKYTSKKEQAEIECGSKQENDETIYFVRDNGAGFDMVYASKLFGAFQRLHTTTEFPGTGIGLATVQRIIHRHGGRIWAEAAVDQGATFFFTLPRLESILPKLAPKERDSMMQRAREII